MARRGEFRELRQDRNPPNNAAGRVPLFAQRHHVKLDPRPKPAARDSVDRLGLEEEALQHGNLHSRGGNEWCALPTLSRDVPPPSRDGEEDQPIDTDPAHNRGGHKTPTTSRPGSPRPAFTSRWSTGPMLTWRG